MKKQLYGKTEQLYGNTEQLYGNTEQLYGNTEWLYGMTEWIVGMEQTDLQVQVYILYSEFQAQNFHFQIPLLGEGSTFCFKDKNKDEKKIMKCPHFEYGTFHLLTNYLP